MSIDWFKIDLGYRRRVACLYWLHYYQRDKSYKLEARAFGQGVENILDLDFMSENIPRVNRRYAGYLEPYYNMEYTGSWRPDPEGIAPKMEIMTMGHFFRNIRLKKADMAPAAFAAAVGISYKKGSERESWYNMPTVNFERYRLLVNEVRSGRDSWLMHEEIRAQ